MHYNAKFKFPISLFLSLSLTLSVSLALSLSLFLSFSLCQWFSPSLSFSHSLSPCQLQPESVSHMVCKMSEVNEERQRAVDLLKYSCGARRLK